MNRRALAYALPLALAACGGTAPDAPGTSADQARELNEAAAMLDDNSVTANAIGVRLDDDNGSQP